MDEDAAFLALRRAESIGRPIGSPEWLAALESRTGRALVPGRRRPRRNSGVK
jgi:putative transposase